MRKETRVLLAGVILGGVGLWLWQGLQPQPAMHAPAVRAPAVPPEFQKPSVSAICAASEQLWCVSPLRLALDELEAQHGACVIEGLPGEVLQRVGRVAVRDLGLEAVEARLFTSAEDWQRYLGAHEMLPHCELDLTALHAGSILLAGVMPEVHVRGERARIRLEDNTTLIGLSVQADVYGEGLDMAYRLPAVLPEGLQAYLTSPRDERDHVVELDGVHLPAAGEEPKQSQSVIFPAFHIHVLQRLRGLEGLRTESGGEAHRAMCGFAATCEWRPRTAPVTEADHVLREHFNVVVAWEQQPVLCFHIGPGQFKKDTTAL